MSHPTRGHMRSMGIGGKASALGRRQGGICTPNAVSEALA